MEVEIKEATLEYLKDIINFNKKLFEFEYKNFDKTLDCSWPPKNKEYFKNSIKGKDSLALVVLDKGKIIGYLIGNIKKAKNYRNIKKIAELDNMFILPDYRNKGIGSLLCKRFLDWVKSRDVKRVRVVVSEKNKGAINCYKKCGFSEYNLILEQDL